MKSEEWREAAVNLLSDCFLSADIWREVLDALEGHDHDLPLFNNLVEDYIACQEQDGEWE